MPRLYRPHIPLSVRCKVAERQLADFPTIQCLHLVVPEWHKLRNRLDSAMIHLARAFGCDVNELRLDHEPPLAARPRRYLYRRGVMKYTPDANDPDHLFYRPYGPQHAGSHLIKTNVRGDHGQHPDRVLIKKARRLTENKPPRRKVKIKSRGFDKVSRPFPKRSK